VAEETAVLGLLGLLCCSPGTVAAKSLAGASSARDWKLKPGQ
jgi:hypothetical protein